MPLTALRSPQAQLAPAKLVSSPAPGLRARAGAALEYSRLVTSASHSRGRPRARVERALGLCARRLRYHTEPMASGTAALAREPGLRSSDAFANALGPLCSARRPRGAEQSARVEPPPTAPAHDTPHTTYPLYAQQPAPAELVKQPTRPQASPGGALEYSVDFGAVCDAPAFLRTLYASGEPPQGSDCAPRQANSAQSPRQLQLSPHERFGQGATALAAAHSSIFALALTTQPPGAHALHGRPREPPQGSSCTPRQADSASSSSQLHSALTSAPDRALRLSALRRRAARLSYAYSCGFSDHTTSRCPAFEKELICARSERCRAHHMLQRA